MERRIWMGTVVANMDGGQRYGILFEIGEIGIFFEMGEVLK